MKASQLTIFIALFILETVSALAINPREVSSDIRNVDFAAQPKVEERDFVSNIHKAAIIEVRRKPAGGSNNGNGGQSGDKKGGASVKSGGAANQASTTSKPAPTALSQSSSAAKPTKNAQSSSQTKETLALKSTSASKSVVSSQSATLSTQSSRETPSPQSTLESKLIASSEADATIQSQATKSKSSNQSRSTTRSRSSSTSSTRSGSSTKDSCFQTGSASPKSKGASSCDDCARAIKNVEAELLGLSSLKRDTDSMGRMLGMLARSELSQRSQKSAKVCEKFEWSAGDYPVYTWKSGTFVMADQPHYGWLKPKDCTSVAWGNPLKAKVSGVKYQIEHVLEWQLVVHFFKWISDKGNTLPDPAGGAKQVDFCTYFEYTFNNPAQFTLPGGTASLTSQEHMAAAYPSKQNFVTEFVLLEGDMNGVAKREIFRDMTKKVKPGVYGQKTMLKQVGKEKDALQVLVKLKALLGVRKYLRNTIISGYFRVQKERMGDVLNLLDTALTAHPKVEGSKTYTPWARQGLKNHWDTYMDERFALAVDRITHEMDNYLNKLSRLYGNSTNSVLVDSINGLTKEWKREQKTKWEAPWVAETTLDGAAGTILDQ